LFIKMIRAGLAFLLRHAEFRRIVLGAIWG